MQHIHPWNEDSRVTSIVRDDFRTADVFRKYSISFCCGGNVPLSLACAQKGLDIQALLQELQDAARSYCLPSSNSFTEWPLDFLVEYIIQVHHRYLDQNLSLVGDYLAGFMLGHKDKFPHLHQIEQLYAKLVKEISSHLQQERDVLFPYIKQVYHAYSNKESYARLLVRTLRKPVEQIMIQEQKGIVHYLDQISQITDHYSLPEKSCPQHLVSFSKLKELDTQIRQELYLENKILFPRAVAMEKELLVSI